jgi:hypothetical protein
VTTAGNTQMLGTLMLAFSCADRYINGDFKFLGEYA